MRNRSPIQYELRLDPLRLKPELAESVIFGLKWSLGSMFEDPFPVRDVVVTVRELVDNLVTHADWDAAPAPCFSVSYRLQKGVPQLRVTSTNVVRDPKKAKLAVDFITELAGKSPAALWQKLTSKLLEPTDIRTNGGIGLLQVASSPRCHLDVRLEAKVFSVTVDVDVPELQQRETPTIRTGS
jgi:hypothetical protein